MGYIQFNYADDYLDWLMFEAAVGTEDSVWTTKFWNYQGKKTVSYASAMHPILTCPSFIGKTTVFYNYFTDYGINGRYILYSQLNKPLVRLHSTKAASQTLIGLDLFASEATRGKRYAVGVDDFSALLPMFRHNNAVNLVYADGHVGSFQRKDFLKTTHPGVWENPYRNVLWEPTRATTYIP